jgi:hypothetical protein
VAKIQLPAVVVLLVVTGAGALAAPGDGSDNLFERALLPGEVPYDVPLRNPDAGSRGDTTWYGQYEVIGGEYYAIGFDNRIDGCWTFDRGTGPIDPPPPLIENGAGWSAEDQTANVATYFRLVDATLDLGPEVEPPIIAGEQSLWVGVDQPDADTLCYACGAGYGNDWNQRCTSPALSYDGSGDVTLSFLYFCCSEPCYDDVLVYLKRADQTELALNPYPAGTCPNNLSFEGGTITGFIGQYTNPETYTRVITAEEIGPAQEIRIIFEFTSDGGYSDEDCGFAAAWGPFAADNVSITGGGIDATYDFEDGLQGWTPAPGAGTGSYAGIADVGAYTIQDVCECGLEGNILELHDGIGDDGFHPMPQHERVSSPICVIADPGMKAIFMEFGHEGHLHGIRHVCRDAVHQRRLPPAGLAVLSIHL